MSRSTGEAIVGGGEDGYLSEEIPYPKRRANRRNNPLDSESEPEEEQPIGRAASTTKTPTGTGRHSAQKTGFQKRDTPKSAAHSHNSARSPSNMYHSTPRGRINR